MIEASVQVRSADDQATHWVVVLYRALRPREGYVVVALAVAAVICLPAAALAGGLIVGLGATPGLAVAALLVAWWLAHRRLRGLLAAPLLAFAGVCTVLVWGVYVLRPWALFLPGVHWLLWWLRGPLTSAPLRAATPAPPLDAFTAQGSALARFGQRVGWWVDGLVTGAGVPDNLVLVALLCLLAWGLAAWAGWWLARNGKPFVALLPSFVLLIIQVYWAPGGIWTLLLFLGVLTMLATLLRLARQMADWESHGVDFSPEIRLDTRIAGLAITMLVVILAPALPFLTSSDLSKAFWRLVEGPYRSVEQRVSPSFASVRPGRSLIPPDGIAPGGLPRAHLLGGRPELGQTLALRVRVRNPKPDERLYWRSQTFAHYTGRGWEEDQEALVREKFAAGEPWSQDTSSASGHPVLVSVTAAESHRAMFFASGEPVSVDRPYWVELRSAGELVALGAEGRPSQYTIVSSVPDVDAAALRAAGAIYPPQIIEPYLQLPPDLPPELAKYAAEITAAAPRTPYDRAVAIEAALRQLPYTLDVPAPPADRELTSWFLFDLQQGYCDYFATAMVVLARLNGIPARLAVGYTMGQFDPQRGDYRVNELNAHSWPELYFPGHGWIPFEPTSALAAPERTELASVPPDWAERMPDELASQMGELRDAATENATARQKSLMMRGIAGGLNGLLACLFTGAVIVSVARRTRPRSLVGPGGELGAAYDRLLRWGARLGRPAAPGDTPREYATALGSTVDGIVGRVRVFRRGAARAAATLDSDVNALAAAYEAATYGPEPESQPGAPVVKPGSWTKLWAAMRRLWLARLVAWPK